MLNPFYVLWETSLIMLEDLSVYLVYWGLTFYSFAAILEFPVLCNCFTFTASKQKKNKFCDSPQTIQGFPNKENHGWYHLPEEISGKRNSHLSEIFCTFSFESTHAPDNLELVEHD
jgi:hypothetical protein